MVQSLGSGEPNTSLIRTFWFPSYRSMRPPAMSTDSLRDLVDLRYPGGMEWSFVKILRCGKKKNPDGALAAHGG